MRKAAVAGAVVAALVGVAAAARPAWGLFSASAVSGQAVQTAALPAPVPSAAGPVWVGGGVQVDGLAGSPASEDVVAATNTGVSMYSPGGLVWSATASAGAVALDPTDGVVVTASTNPPAVTVLSARTGGVERTVPLPATANTDWLSATLVVNPATGTVWVVLSSFEGAEVVSLDPTTGKLGGVISLPPLVLSTAGAGAWDGGELVLANSSDGVTFVNTATGDMTGPPLPGEPEGIAVSPTGVVAVTLPYTGGGELAILSSPTASPDIVPVPNVGTGVTWDTAAGKFAVAMSNGTLFVGTGGQETLLTWPTFAGWGGAVWQFIAPVAGGVAQSSVVAGLAFVVAGMADVGASGVSVSTAPAEPPDAMCQILAGPTQTGPWEVVGSELCPGDDNYPPLTVAPPAGDTWFAVRATVNAWQSPPTQATQWSVPTAGTGA